MKRFLCLYLPYLPIERLTPPGIGETTSPAEEVTSSGSGSAPEQRPNVANIGDGEWRMANGECRKNVHHSVLPDITQPGAWQTSTLPGQEKTPVVDRCHTPVVDRCHPSPVTNRCHIPPVENRCHTRAVAVIAPAAGVLRVTACNPAAARLGVRVGMTSAEAAACGEVERHGEEGNKGVRESGSKGRAESENLTGTSEPGYSSAFFPHSLTPLLPYSLFFVFADPVGDAKAIEQLAAWAQVLSPIVHIEDERTLIVDITGCQRLFGGEMNILRRAGGGMHARGFSVRAAIAGSPGAAWALAHDHPDAAVITEPGADLSELAGLGVRSLRIDERTAKTLESVGVATIGTLVHLPRSSLPSRFGQMLTTRLAQMLGETPELLTPFCPPPTLRRDIRFGVATDRFDVLAEAVRRLTRSFCDALAERESGVRRAAVTFYLLTGPPVSIDLAMARSTRAAAHIESLLLTRLSDLRLPAPAEGVTIWTRQIDTLRHRQGDLFEPAVGEEEVLGELVDRLRSALGGEAVLFAEPVDDHQPERAWKRAARDGFAGSKGEIAAKPRAGKLRTGKPRTSKRQAPQPRTSIPAISETQISKTQPGEPRASARADVPPEESLPFAQLPPRPMHLFDRPRETAVVALTPDGPPLRFRWEGREHQVARFAGPERIETGWWRGKQIRRDYYRVTTRTGGRFWLFRRCNTSEWFVHGTYD